MIIWHEKFEHPQEVVKHLIEKYSDENGDFYELIQNGINKQYIKIGTFTDGDPYFDD